jgi:hypothetical protein
MRILIDTNVIINREEDKIISSELQELLEIISQLNYQLLVHPLSVAEIADDEDGRRKEINLSKIGTYPKLEQPPVLLSGSNFFSILGITEIDHEKNRVDNNLLYCVYKDAVHLLITDDKKIVNKAKKLGVADKVFNVHDALIYFRTIPIPHKIILTTSPAIKETPVYNIDLTDPFFDDLKNDYGGHDFVDWWKRISKQGRKAWVYHTEKGIGAILIYKTEDEIIQATPPLPKKNRVKICTLKVSHTGFKIGELLIKLSISFAIRNQLDEIFLTHYQKENDRLTDLIQQYGFFKVAKKIDGEDVWIKKLIPDDECTSPLDVQRRFYPSFYDGDGVKKFIVPIWPKFHDRLFTDYDKRQPKLEEFFGELIVEGNTIKKAYLTHSRIKRIDVGDLLIFYRSLDRHMLTSIGVVESILNDSKDPDLIQKEATKRTVYSREEIESMAQKPTKVILFYHNFHFPNTLNLDTLRRHKILKAQPQSIQEIDHETYLKIREISGLNKRFCVGTLKIG